MTFDVSIGEVAVECDVTHLSVVARLQMQLVEDIVIAVSFHGKMVDIYGADSIVQVRSLNVCGYVGRETGITPFVGQVGGLWREVVKVCF